jgi:glutamate-1-semialdehyde 2,1-aminomutase
VSESLKLFELTKTIFAGGVNSPVRALVKPYPLFIERAEGAYLYTIDGYRLVDYVMGYGPLILGHRHPRVYDAVIEQLGRGWLYGAPARAAFELGKIICRNFGVDKIRFVNSGTEAVMTAVRLARGYTNRAIVVKFDGCYHGASDPVLVKAGSSALEYGLASSKGIPDEVTKYTYVLPYNDIDTINKFMIKLGNNTACIIVEPVVANAGLILPNKDFLKELRYLSDKFGSLLIFDEVVTGYRISLNGASGYYKIRPDIITLGKIIGGGFPIGAIAGGKKIMEMLTPTGKVFNAGTFNAHPISMAAGLATIKELQMDRHYEIANRAANEITSYISEKLGEMNIKFTVNRIGSMFQLFFGVDRVTNANEARKADKEKYVRLHELLIKNGVYIPPSNMETCFTSSMHDDEAISASIDAIKKTLSILGNEIG